MNSQLPLVYVIDDDPSVGRSLGRLLSLLGLRSRWFSSGPELLATSDLNQAACSIVDVHMPEMNGFELARLLSERAPDLPVIFITAHVEEAEQWRKKQPGGVALLVKPFSEQELVAALSLALGSPPSGALST